MKKKSIYPRIFGICLSILLLLILTMHFTNFKRIMTTQYSDAWNIPVKIKDFNQTDGFYSLVFNNNPAMLSINSLGDINITTYNSSGIKVDSYKMNLSILDKKSISSIKIIDNSLYYLANSKLYNYNLTTNKTTLILDKKINNFSIHNTSKNSLLAYNTETTTSICSLEDVNQIIYSSNYFGPVNKISIEYLNNSYYMAYLNDQSDLVDKKLELLNISKNSSPILISDLSINSGSIGNVNLLSLKNDFYLAYSKYTGKKGIYDTHYFIDSLDKDNLSVTHHKEITKSNEHFSDIKNLIKINKKDDALSIVTIADNKKNHYLPDGADLIEILYFPKEDRIESSFITTASEPIVDYYYLVNNDNEYTFTRHIFTSDQHFIKLNSTSEKFKENKSHKKMYIFEGVMTSISGMVYGAIMMFPRVLYMVIYLAPIAFILFLLQKFKLVKTNKTTAIIMCISYIILNLFTIDFFTHGIGTIFMPDFLKSTLGNYLIPLLVNLICLSLLYIHSKSLKRPNILFYASIFVLLDIFIQSQIFLPFAMLFAK